MNDLQKKLAIVGITAFIVWLFISIEANEGLGIPYMDDLSEWIQYTILYNKWQTILFMTWIGSLIAFNVYKD
jgi:hypothetical protein